MTQLDVPVLDADARALLATTAPAVPAGFAERVMARRAAAAIPAPRWRWWPALAAVAVGLLLLVAVRMVPAAERTAVASPRAGTAAATQRTTLDLGGRATAVLEPGTTIAWTVDGADAARVVQPAGDVFYRVERGGAFVVHTPSGDVTVTGTCFRVAVARGELAVTVYEGEVSIGEAGAHLVAGSRFESATPHAIGKRVAAGERHVARLEPVTPSPTLPAMPADRDSELLALAADCRISWDQPRLYRDDLIPPAAVARLGIDEPTRVRLEQALRELHARSLATVRQAYIDVTGDADHAEALSWDALIDEVVHKSRERDLQDAFRRISAERAGLASAPASLADRPAVERMYRVLTTLGDDTEREIAAVLGAERARALRAERGGWADRHEVSHGCPN